MRSLFKIQWQWAASLIPVLLGLLLVIILDAFDIIEFRFNPYDFDTFIIFCGLILTIVLVFVLLSRVTVRRIEILGLEHARQEANADRARFLRRLDHELKNPLMGIKMAVTNLASCTDVAQYQRISDDIDRQVKRLSRLVTDLRKFADLGTQPLELQEVDVVRLLHDIESISREEIGAETHTLSFHIPDTLPTLYGDYDLLVIAIYNIMSNALKFTQPDDHIELRAQADDQSVIIQVSDTGPGIAPQDMPFVWDELYRAQATKSVPGSGIGLSLIKLIIERHGGSVSIQSQLGQGVTVTLRLPRRGLRSAEPLNTTSHK